MLVKTHILAVGANTDFKKMIANALDAQKFNVCLYDQEEHLIKQASVIKSGIIIIWGQQKGEQCGNFIRYLNAHYPQFFLVVISPKTGKLQTVEMIQAGATDCLVYPIKSTVLSSHIERLISRPSHKSQNGTLIAQAPATLHTLRLASRAAESDASILIGGESGTGKEMLARFIHDNSPRRSSPFVAINCAAIPETMLESILFGHEKGAFTGATKRHLGKFEQAIGGTLFLDEVAEMPLNQQAKLLRALQEREVERLGGGMPIKIDVRVIAASNRDLVKQVRTGAFRKDLFYRLNVFPLQLEPLKNRREDILPLANHFLVQHDQPDQPHLELSQEAEETLIHYDWPGNIRELKNVIHRAAILRKSWVIMKNDLLLPQESVSDTSLRPDNHLDESESEPAPETTHFQEEHKWQLPGSSRKQQEWLHVIKVLQRNGGHRGNSAKELGLSTRMLRYKLARLRANGIDIDAVIS